MDNRVLLAIVLSIGILILFQYLYLQYLAPKPPQGSVNQTLNQTAQGNQSLTGKPLASIETSKVDKELPEKKITIETPFYEAKITNYGVRFSSLKLLQYPKDLKSKEPVELISAPKEGLPLEIYTTQAPYLALVPFEGDLPEKITLSSKDNKDLIFRTKVSGLDIEKKLLFKGDSYYYDLEVKLSNSGNETIKDRLLIRGVFAPYSKGSGYVFKGPFYYTDQLNEVNLKDSLSEYTGPLKYLGYMDVYFLTALIPFENGTFKGTFRKLSEEVNEFIFWSDEFSLRPGDTKTFKFKVYMGPKRAEDLKKEYPLLARSLYFGIFDFVAKPLLYLLKFFYQFTHNYGWAIVIITFLIRVLFYPLNHISYKSMKKMQELQPVFQRLREKYKDDPQTLQREMMNLYRTHKINPFSGCLPILIQIPVFIAFYKVLLMAIELRLAPFMLWITDLSSPERLYLGNLVIPWLGGIPVLTILMGVSMFFQQKLTPTSMDPTQEKIMLILPIFFTVLFINFPSGLVLYWFVNNLLSIGQQLITFKVSKKR
ncbi:preprotein translocase subunit YajC [Caldimicrobium thiodismutans]|uniref:Membrane protein insertase YidC n=1 Tax=Caldimicrobium thiodismutans TaxID=1653476 RepID=A0A0U5BZB3_9BACT|nr:membrane protein insertase YidC [Caldimicrobium thiodismutans]BAU24165.1 preprotein translocase subunit YajC [Caldimicrobium thiodismutans]